MCQVPQFAYQGSRSRNVTTTGTSKQINYGASKN